MGTPEPIVCDSCGGRMDIEDLGDRDCNKFVGTCAECGQQKRLDWNLDKYVRYNQLAEW